MNEEKINMEKEIYQQLIDEAMYNNSKQDKYTNYAYVIVAAIWAASFSSSISWITMIPLILLIPICFRIADCRYSIALISSFIQEYLDKKFNTCWQTNRMKFNNKFSNKRIIYHCSKLDIPFISIVCVLIFWFMRYSQGVLIIHSNIGLTILMVFFQVFIVVLDFYVCIKYSDMNKMKKELLSKWKELEKLC